jgi:hypothetical protein
MPDRGDMGYLKVLFKYEWNWSRVRPAHISGCEGMWMKRNGVDGTTRPKKKAPADDDDTESFR